MAADVPPAAAASAERIREFIAREALAAANALIPPVGTLGNGGKVAFGARPATTDGGTMLAWALSITPSADTILVARAESAGATAERADTVEIERARDVDVGAFAGEASSARVLAADAAESIDSVV